MSSQLFSPPSRALDSNGDPYSGAKWYFYLTETSTAQAVYADADLATSLGAVVTADSGGKFENIYFDPAILYRGVCKNSDGSVTLHDIDPINSDAGVQLLALLAADGGAELIGTSSGETVQEVLNTIYSITATEQAIAYMQKNFLPFSAISSVYTGDLLPTADSPVAAMRLHAEWILVRVRTSSLSGSSWDNNLYWDEYVLRDPAGYADVAGGWQIVLHRVYAKGRYSNWLTSPDAPGDIPNADFALRIGNINNTYESSGDTGNWRFCGFGHGRLHNTPANNQITLDGGGPNLQSTANWPVNTQLYGDSLVVDCDYKLMLPPADYADNPLSVTNLSATVTVTHVAHGYSTGLKLDLAGLTDTGGIVAANLNGTRTITVTGVDTYTFTAGAAATSTTTGGGTVGTYSPEAVSLNYIQTFGASQGCRRYGVYSADIDDVGIQDSYGHMMPVSPYAVTHFKPSGASPAIALVHDSVQYGNWTTGVSQHHQAYNSSDPTMILQMTLEYNTGGTYAPLRKQGGGLAAWGQNMYGRYFYRDLPDFAKYYIFINSSEASLPRTAWALPTGNTYEWQNTLKTVYQTSGPS